MLTWLIFFKFNNNKLRASLKACLRGLGGGGSVCVCLFVCFDKTFISNQAFGVLNVELLMGPILQQPLYSYSFYYYFLNCYSAFIAKNLLWLLEWILASGKEYLQNQLCWNVLRCNRRMQECDIFILVIAEVLKCKYKVCVYKLIPLYIHVWKNFSLTLPPSWFCSEKYWTKPSGQDRQQHLSMHSGFILLSLTRRLWLVWGYQPCHSQLSS